MHIIYGPSVYNKNWPKTQVFLMCRKLFRFLLTYELAQNQVKNIFQVKTIFRPIRKKWGSEFRNSELGKPWNEHISSTITHKCTFCGERVMELQMANCDLHKSWKGKKKYEVFLVKSWASTRLSLWLELISMFSKMHK